MRLLPLPDAIFVFLLSLLCLIFLSSVSGAQQTGSPPVVYRIGWIGPLTGDSSILGIDSAEIASQIFKKANKKQNDSGIRFELIVEDDAYDVSRAVTAYQRLSSGPNKVDVIIMISYGGVLATAERAKRDGIIVINPLDCDEELASLPENNFCMAKRTEDVGIVAAAHAVHHNHGPAAIIYFDGNPFGVKISQSTLQHLTENGVEVPVTQAFSDLKNDYRPVLTRARSAGVKSLFVYGPDDFSTAIRLARESGVTAQIYALASVNSPTSRDLAGSALEGIVTAGWFAPDSKRYRALLEDYKKEVGREPYLDVSVVPTYDVATILTEAYQTLTENKLSREERINYLRQYLLDLRDYEGISGTITMDSDGAVRSLQAGLRKIKGEGIVEVTSK